MSLQSLIQKNKDKYQKAYEEKYKGIIPDEILRKGNSWMTDFLTQAMTDTATEMAEAVRLEGNPCSLCSRPLIEHKKHEENGILFCPCLIWHKHNDDRTTGGLCLGIAGTDEEIGYNQAKSELDEKISKFLGSVSVSESDHQNVLPSIPIRPH